ncbi:RNA-dependent RNA polymerase 6 [Tanacetum coccineum]
MAEYRRVLVTRPHVGIGSFDVNAATRPQVGLGTLQQSRSVVSFLTDDWTCRIKRCYASKGDENYLNPVNNKSRTNCVSNMTTLQPSSSHRIYHLSSRDTTNTSRNINKGKSVSTFDIPRMNLNGSDDEAYDSRDDAMFYGTSISIFHSHLLMSILKIERRIVIDIDGLFWGKGNSTGGVGGGSDDADNGLKHLVDCLVFPQKGDRPHTDEAFRSDLDGDLYIVTWDEHLIPPSKQSWLPMEFTATEAKKLPRDARHSDIIDFFTKNMVNDSLGTICNAHVVHAIMGDRSLRSIMFNIKDPKNQDFRRKVLLGYVKPERILELTPKEMVSTERQMEIGKIKWKALFDCERGLPPKDTVCQSVIVR